MVPGIVPNTLVWTTRFQKEKILKAMTAKKILRAEVGVGRQRVKIQRRAFRHEPI